jgi:hypothetical protein
MAKGKPSKHTDQEAELHRAAEAIENELFTFAYPDGVEEEGVMRASIRLIAAHRLARQIVRAKKAEALRLLTDIDYDPQAPAAKPAVAAAPAKPVTPTKSIKTSSGVEVRKRAPKKGN